MNMIAKMWKKIGIIILIIACLFNIVTKLVKKVGFEDELETSAKYVINKNNEK